MVTDLWDFCFVSVSIILLLGNNVNIAAATEHLLRTLSFFEGHRDNKRICLLSIQIRIDKIWKNPEDLTHSSHEIGRVQVEQCTITTPCPLGQFIIFLFKFFKHDRGCTQTALSN